MSGRKVAGCCVHVASVIFYLSYSRHYNLKLPALNKHLVLIDTSKKQKPNNPTLVRVKRTKNNEITNNSNESESSSSEESDKEYTDSESDVSESNSSEKDTDQESRTDGSLTEMDDD